MKTQTWEAADIANRATISEIVTVYNAELDRIERAYTALGEAGRNLTAAFGRETTYSDISTLPRSCHDWEYALDEVRKAIKCSCWKHLIDRLGVKRIISLKRLEELNNRLNDPKQLPEITVDSVFETFDLLVGSANVLAREAVKEVYDAFHVRVPTCDYELKHTLKTNLRNATEDLGEKIIVRGVLRVEWGGAGYRLEYGCYGTDKIRALDKVFHNLAGAPFSEAGYESPLIDAIHQAGPAGKGETEYFKFKCYQNGNLHLEFKRLDLLREFNRIANDGTELKSGRVF